MSLKKKFAIPPSENVLYVAYYCVFMQYVHKYLYYYYYCAPAAVGRRRQQAQYNIIRPPV